MYSFFFFLPLVFNSFILAHDCFPASPFFTFYFKTIIESQEAAKIVQRGPLTSHPVAPHEGMSYVQSSLPVGDRFVELSQKDDG